MNLFLNDIVVNEYSDAFIFVNENHSYCYDNNKNFIKESNDSCNLFNGVCQPPNIQNEDIYFNVKVIPFISHFHTGVHAYSGIYSILFNYITKLKPNDEYKIVIYEGTQTGILEILYSFFNEDKIILLKQNTVYKFLEIKLIPNSLHSFLENHIISEEISKLIMEKIKIKNNNIYPKKIAIIKTYESSVTSTMGSIDKKTAIDYCNTNGFKLIEPSEVGEVLLANYINNCEEIIFSWGTTFMKNFIYLSEKATNAEVLIFGEPFKYEYSIAIKRDIIVKTYKNCVFKYKVDKF